jgi:hypothetical protein
VKFVGMIFAPALKVIVAISGTFMTKNSPWKVDLILDITVVFPPQGPPVTTIQYTVGIII